MDNKTYDTNTNRAYHITPLLGALLFLSISALLGIWIMQKSINAYIFQTYHFPSPLSAIEQPLWKQGEIIGDTLYQYHNEITAMIADFNQTVVDNFNTYYAYTPEYKQALLKKQQEEAIRLANERALQEKQAQDNQLNRTLTINPSHKVFFAGDSLMQGIAPHIQKYLQGFGIQSVNLSKQSTGLAYPKFFDWQTTIKETINKDNSIKVLVIMLGANDPWDMPNDKGKYLKFNSPEWQVEYQARIADIISFANKHNVGVIWITPPNMKKDKLNEQMIQLNAIIGEELARHQVKAIDGRDVMGGVNNRYNDYLTKDGKQIKIRSGDGIHFSPEGQKILAQVVQSQLIIE